MILENQAWRLSDSVSLRPEPFGAMAYDFKTRRLTFLKTKPLVAVVELLNDAEDVTAAMDGAGIDPELRPSYLRALESLARSGMLVPRTSDPEVPAEELSLSCP